MVKDKLQVTLVVFVLMGLSTPSRLNINAVSVHFRAQSSYKD